MYVFNLETGRENIVQPILDELHLQARQGQPAMEVGLGGLVRVPGRYPLEPGMRVSDLIRAGGRLGEAAFVHSAELARYEIVDARYRATELIEINLERVLAGDSTADLALRPYDHLTIKELPQWSEQEYMQVLGEVTFPGEYPIRRGETLRGRSDLFTDSV